MSQPSPTTERSRPAPEHIVRRRVKVLDLQRRARLPALLIEIIEEQGALLSDISSELEHSATDLADLADTTQRLSGRVRMVHGRLVALRPLIPKSKRGKTLLAVIDALISELTQP